MQMMWLKIDVGLSRVLRRKPAFPTRRAPDGCVDGCVKYPDAHAVGDVEIILLDGKVCDGCPPGTPRVM
jgi:hypothetical protein